MERYNPLETRVLAYEALSTTAVASTSVDYLCLHFLLVSSSRSLPYHIYIPAHGFISICAVRLVTRDRSTPPSGTTSAYQKPYFIEFVHHCHSSTNFPVVFNSRSRAFRNGPSVWVAHDWPALKEPLLYSRYLLSQMHWVRSALRRFFLGFLGFSWLTLPQKLSATEKREVRQCYIYLARIESTSISYHNEMLIALTPRQEHPGAFIPPAQAQLPSQRRRGDGPDRFRLRHLHLPDALEVPPHPDVIVAQDLHMRVEVVCSDINLTMALLVLGSSQIAAGRGLLA